MIRTSIIAGLFALMASSAWAQTDAGKSAPNLDPGSSGGNAGLISGGGVISSNFDGRDARPSPEARTSAHAQSKIEPNAKDESASSKARVKAARARAEASNDDDSGKSEQTKKAKKQQRVYGYPYVYPFGFSTFGNRGYVRNRD